MGEINIYVNNFLADKERFADLVNGFVFEGRCLVKADALENMETKSWRARETSSEGIRDQLKCWKYKGRTVIFGVEAEQNIQYAMPVRLLDYDAMQYKKEYKRRKKKHREKKDLPACEYISGVTQKEQFYPIFSLVLYLGEEVWDARTHLSQMCGLATLSEEIYMGLRPLFNDYHTNVYDVNRLENVDVFHTDLREVLGFLRYRKDKVRLKRFINENEGFRHMKTDAYHVLMCYGNLEVLRIQKEKYDTEGEIDMCQAINDMINEAKTEGEREGRREGRREGIREEHARGEERLQSERAKQKKIRLLFRRLVEERRYDELAHATQEEAVCDKLMLEYGI